MLSETDLTNLGPNTDNKRAENLKAEFWGLVDYQVAVERQLHLVNELSLYQRTDTVVFCTHPPVVTLGRTTPKADLLSWSGSVIESSRGGRATYHGPSQLVVYPILDLRREDHAGLRARDVGGYIRLLGQCVVDVTRQLGIESVLRQGVEKDEDGHARQLTGIWVGERKLASIGVAVKKWITYHGIAINLRSDPQAFSGIRPCGFKPGTMTSLQELGVETTDQKVAELFLNAMNRSLKAKPTP
jgi:lipoyl(octanoyl) transferase